jgi:hypothetical protein
MNKRLILLLVTSLFVMATSCKKEQEKTNYIQSDTNTTVTESISTPTPPPDGKYPELSFEKQEHDFGTIKQGDKVTYEFKFKNTGQADLLISDAKGSCGCTVPEYPKTPIMPGEDGKLKVSFDSSGKSGLNTKSVTITCNTKENNKIINIKANIEPSLATK